MKTIVEVIKIVVVGLLSLFKYKDMFPCMFSCWTCEFRLNPISVDSFKLSLTQVANTININGESETKEIKEDEAKTAAR